MSSSTACPSTPESQAPKRCSDAPRWVWVLIAFVFLKTAVVWLSETRFNPDKVVQIGVARSFLDGRGLTQSTVDVVDGKLVVRDLPMRGWAPGFALLEAGLIWIIPDVILVNRILDLACIGLFLFSWKVIAGRFFADRGAAGQILFWAVWALLPTPIEYLTSSDLIACAMFFSAVAIAVASLPKCNWIGPMSLAGIIAAGAAWIQFRFLPLVIVIPLGVLVSRTPRFLLERSTVCSTVAYCAGCVPVCVGLIVLQWIRLGSLTGGGSGSDRGWYLHNLQRTYPFPLDLTGYSELQHYLAHKSTVIAATLDHPALVTFLSVALGVLLIGVLSGFVYRTSARQYAAGIIAATGLSTIAITLSLLSWYAVASPPQVLGQGELKAWTAVQEERYFGPIMPFLHLSLASMLGHLYSRRSITSVAFLAALSIVILLGSIQSQRVWISYALNYKDQTRHVNVSRDQSEFNAAYYLVEQAKTESSFLLVHSLKDSSHSSFHAAIIAGAHCYESHLSRLNVMSLPAITQDRQKIRVTTFEKLRQTPTSKRVEH